MNSQWDVSRFLIFTLLVFISQYESLTLPCYITNETKQLNCSEKYELPPDSIVKINLHLSEDKANFKLKSRFGKPENFTIKTLTKSVWKLLSKINDLRIEFSIEYYQSSFFPSDLALTHLSIKTMKIKSCAFKNLPNLKSLEIKCSEKKSKIMFHKDAFTGLGKLKKINIYNSMGIDSYPAEGKTKNSNCEHYFCALKMLKKINIELPIPCVNVKMVGIPLNATVTPKKYEIITEGYKDAICIISKSYCRYDGKYESCGSINECFPEDGEKDGEMAKSATTSILLIVLLILLLVILIVAVAIYMKNAHAAKQPIPTAVPT